MRTGSYIGRIVKSFDDTASEHPIFTISLPNYACEVRFKIEGNTRNKFAYSWNPKYNTDKMPITQGTSMGTDYYTFTSSNFDSGYAGVQATNTIIWRHVEGMPNALFIIPVLIGDSSDMILNYSIIGGKNDGY